MEVTHLLFAYDTLLFCNLIPKLLLNIRCILWAFKLSHGSIFSFLKSFHGSILIWQNQTGLVWRREALDFFS